MRLTDYLIPEGIRVSLKARDREGALHELSELAAGVCPARLPQATIFDVLLAREQLATTAVGSGVAIPHGRFAVRDFSVVIGLASHGVAFEAVDRAPVDIFVAVVAPEADPAGQLRMLARISKLLRVEAVRARLRAANQSRDVLDALLAQEQWEARAIEA